MEKTGMISYSSKWKVCCGGYQLVPAPESAGGLHPDEDSIDVCFNPIGEVISEFIIPKNDEWREYEFPLPEIALWSFLGLTVGGSDGDIKGRFLSRDELLEWTNQYGLLHFCTEPLGFEDLEFEQRLMVAVYRLLENHSELERKEDGYYYVDGIQFDGWYDRFDLKGYSPINPPLSEHGIDIDMRLVSVQHVLKYMLHIEVEVYPKIIPSEEIIVIEKTLKTSLAGNLWIDLLNALYGEDSKTASCIFCGERQYISQSTDQLNPLKPPSRGIEGYYHEKCRQRFWRQGDRHPEKRAELHKKYGLTWGTKGKKD